MLDTVQAAGAVLWRRAANGIEICVVHRPAYDDWSLPKGKLHGAEHPVAAAAREVLEETGFRGVPQLRLPPVAYTLSDGRPKNVDFWLMRAADTAAVEVADPAEVDAIAWLAPADAAARLSYPDDRGLVERVVGLVPISAVTAIVRHAHAGERKAWAGNDALRPIDQQGHAEARALAEILVLFEPTRLLTATPLRCKQTLEPLAERLGMPIVMDGAFAEPEDPEDVPAKVKAAATRLTELRAEDTTVICSQGKVMPPLLAHLHRAAEAATPHGTEKAPEEDDPAPYKTPKGGGWILSWSGEILIGLSKL